MKNEHLRPEGRGRSELPDQQPQSRLLWDEELVRYVHLEKKLVTGLPELEGQQWYARTSPVQPASIDLHIGEIYVPQSSKAVSQQAGREYYVLKSGFAAMVTTAEEVDLPSNVAAISFPPNHVAMNGLLMTNAGHIDPGYRGKLRFTLINMGKDDFPLVVGKEIVTVLFFEMAQPCTADYAKRGAVPSGKSMQERVNILSRDLVDLQKKISSTSRRIAVKTVLGAAALSLIITILGAGMTLWMSLLLDRTSEVKAVQRDMIELRTELKAVQDKTSMTHSEARPAPPARGEGSNEHLRH